MSDGVQAAASLLGMSLIPIPGPLAETASFPRLCLELLWSCPFIMNLVIGALGEAAVHSPSTDACLESLSVLGVGSGSLFDDILEACIGFQAPDMQCVLGCQGHLGCREGVYGGTSCGIITGRGSRGHIYLGQRIRHSLKSCG